jgi:DNA-binding NarL/FixJ family response regulator
MHISKEIVHIAIAATSVVIRRGLSSTLESLSSLRAHIVEVSSMEGLSECMEAHSPDILVVEPFFCGKFNLEQMKELYPSVKYVALVVCDKESGLLAGYDDILSVYDEIGIIGRVFEKLSGHDYEEEADVLSQREREIVVCVVRGLTNKEIADELCISVHTVITHRKNISRKLQIHSVAGLTIYAIANKLIELKDLN